MLHSRSLQSKTIGWREWGERKVKRLDAAMEMFCFDFWPVLKEWSRRKANWTVSKSLSDICLYRMSNLRRMERQSLYIFLYKAEKNRWENEIFPDNNKNGINGKEALLHFNRPFGGAAAAGDPKRSAELPRPETQSVRRSCRGRRPEAFGGAAAAGDFKRLCLLNKLN